MIGMILYWGCAGFGSLESPRFVVRFSDCVRLIEISNSVVISSANCIGLVYILLGQEIAGGSAISNILNSSDSNTVAFLMANRQETAKSKTS